MLKSPNYCKSMENGSLFGATFMSLYNPYFVVLNMGINTIIEEHKDRLITLDPILDQEKQNKQILDLINKDVKAIFLTPVDWIKVEPALVACKEANMPVFNIDSEVFNSNLVVAIIASDNYQIGVKIANNMMERRKAAKIVILDFPPTKSSIDRVQGFLDTIAGKPQYEVIARESGGNLFEVSKNVMERLLKEFEDIDVVMGSNDITALGALTALEDVGRAEDTLIYGVDGSPEAKFLVEEGKMTGTVAQFPIEMGMTSAEIAYAYLEGDKIEKRIFIPTVLITKENIYDFGVVGWQ
ncbi:sugar ABC transporter substrate-binding protein [Anaerosacchariphilus polymeriproducens]|nr:sugar ABC transporter substrate-binding protein [Anaerosacchariphilus polymeriproducens]